MARIVTADLITEAAHVQLVDLVPAFAAALDLSPVSTWQQLPTVQALQSAVTPAGAIACPGLVGPPVKRRDGTYAATWRLVVAVYDRGATATRDPAGYASTQKRAHRWAGVIRAAILADPTLGLDGIVETTTWVGEDFADNIDSKSVRTLSCAAVSFDVTVPVALDLLDVTNPPQPGPLVLTTDTRVTVRPRP